MCHEHPCNIYSVRNRKCKNTVLNLPGWVLLWLEQCIKVPETRFNKVVGWHLSEAHLKENLTVFRPDLGRNPCHVSGSVAFS